MAKIEYFGHPWNSHISGFIERMPTPEGEKCGCGCGQTINNGQQGIIMDSVECDESGNPAVVTRRPWLLDHFLSHIGLNR